MPNEGMPCLSKGVDFFAKITRCPSKIRMYAMQMFELKNDMSFEVFHGLFYHYASVTSNRPELVVNRQPTWRLPRCGRGKMHAIQFEHSTFCAGPHEAFFEARATNEIHTAQSPVKVHHDTLASNRFFKKLGFMLACC